MMRSLISLCVIGFCAFPGISCRKRVPQTDSPFQLSAIPAVDTSGEGKACEDELPDPICSGSDCNSLVSMSWKDKIISKVETSEGFHYASKKLKMLLEHSAGLTACVTKNWKNNGDGIHVGDISSSKGTTPAVNGWYRHPSVSHKEGKDVDLAYYQVGYSDNKSRIICPSQNNHCVGSPKYLDAYKTAVFIAALHKDPTLRVVGVDGMVAAPVQNAIIDLCKRGIIKGNACAGIKLAFETTDTGRNWFYYHHTHLHVSTVALGQQSPEVLQKINVGNQDPNESWFTADKIAQVKESGDRSTQAPEIQAPAGDTSSGNPEIDCYYGFLKNPRGVDLCTVWTNEEKIVFYVPFSTPTCDQAALATNLDNETHLQFQKMCSKRLYKWEGRYHR